MAQKQTVSFRMHPHLLQQFQKAAEAFQGKLGACFSAACLQWMESDPKIQAEYLKRLYEAELRDEVEAAVGQAKVEQVKKIKSREDSPKNKRS
jgi:hypothetical protein